MGKSFGAIVLLYVAFPFLATAQHMNDHSQHDHGSPIGQKASGERGHEDHERIAAAPPITAPDRAATVESPLKQTTCPVTGDPVKADSFASYEGQMVLFCCDQCVDRFNKSPLYYLPAVYRQIYPQHMQATCPVMGGEIDPKVSINFQGQKVFFCCAGCGKKFQNEPATYEAKLKAEFTQQVHCPVDGKPISPTISLEKEGATYFCSEQCREKFKGDPAYAPAAFPAVGVLAAGPTTAEDIVTCAVAGQIGKRREMISLVYQGKVYFAHSSACINRFKVNPAVHAQRAAEPAKPARPLQRMLVQPTNRGNLLYDAYQPGHGGHGASGVNSAGRGASRQAGPGGHGGHGGGSAGGGCGSGCSH